MAPLSPLASGHANDLGGAEGVEAVHKVDADLDFGGLAVWVSCCDAFPEGPEAPHLGFDAAAVWYPVQRFQNALP